MIQEISSPNKPTLKSSASAKYLPNGMQSNQQQISVLKKQSFRNTMQTSFGGPSNITAKTVLNPLVKPNMTLSSPIKKMMSAES